MLLLITSDRGCDFDDELAQMHALRHRVFKEGLGWDVETVAGMEADSFDALRPAYLLLCTMGTISGCVRRRDLRPSIWA